MRALAAGGANLHIEAIFLEDARVHANVEIDVTEIMNRFAEAHFLKRSSGSGFQPDHGGQRQATCDSSGCFHEMPAGSRDTIRSEKSADSIDSGSNLLEIVRFHRGLFVGDFSLNQRKSCQNLSAN